MALKDNMATVGDNIEAGTVLGLLGEIHRRLSTSMYANRFFEPMLILIR